MRTSPGVAVTPCPRCGRTPDPDARFCAGCGMALEAPAAPAPSPRVPPAPPPAPLPPPVFPVPTGPGLAVSGPPATPLVRPGGPPVEPASIGRRASPLGWVAVVLGAGVFLAASVGVLALAGGRATGGPADPGAAEPAPLARFDGTLYDGSTITAGEPFEIEVEAVNGAGEATAPLWLVVDWQPDDLPSTPAVRGGFVACEPADCTAADEPAEDRTVVAWPGLDAGERHVLRVTVRATGIEPGTTLWYRVSTGSGETAGTMDGGYTWDLDLEVE